MTKEEIEALIKNSNDEIETRITSKYQEELKKRDDIINAQKKDLELYTKKNDSLLSKSVNGRSNERSVLGEII